MSVGMAICMAIAISICYAICFAICMTIGMFDMSISKTSICLGEMCRPISIELLSATKISLDVELRKQEEEHDCMTSNPPHEGTWVMTFSEGELECMTEDQDKLDHLEVGKVLLPPNETAVFGSHGRQHVVDVHHNMHEGVDKTKESAVSTCSELDAEPDTHGHTAVVDDMQQ